MIARQSLPETWPDEKRVLRTLLYFDIFHYPLTTEEIFYFSTLSDRDATQAAIATLVQRGLIFRVGEFYAVQDDPSLATRRERGNQLAERRMITAKKNARWIYAMPFVRAVLLSGSISKNYMDADSDIDYFIITEANRVWIVRTLLALFRRLFLLNSHRNLCTNYFVDTDNLTIRDVNLYTATEVSTLKPMFGEFTIAAFRQTNSWVADYLPNHPPLIGQAASSDKVRWLEKIFPSAWLTRWNHWLMNRTLNYWKTRYAKNISLQDFELAFRSTPGISKSHPANFQKKALNLLEDRIHRFQQHHAIDLSV